MKPVIKLLCFFVLTLQGVQAVFAAEVDATVKWSEKRIVQFAVDGVVENVNVEQGDAFEKGEVLLSLDGTVYEQRLNMQKAKTSGLRSLFDDADRELKQANVLYEQTVLSDVELQKVRVSYDLAKSDLEQAEAQLKIAQWELRQTVIRAPWAGFVLEGHVSPGKVVSAENKDTSLLVLARTDKFTVLGWVPKHIGNSIRKSDKVDVKVGGRTYPGIVKKIYLNMLNPVNKGKYHLTVEFDSDPAQSLIAGQAAVIKLR